MSPLDPRQTWRSQQHHRAKYGEVVELTPQEAIAKEVTELQDLVLMQLYAPKEVAKRTRKLRVTK